MTPPAAEPPLSDGIAANLPAMVYRFAMAPDGAFTLRFASSGARDLYGVDPAALMENAELAMVVHPDERAEYLESIERSAKDLSRWEWRGRLVRPDGRIQHVHAVSQPFRETDGTVVWDGVVVAEVAPSRSHVDAPYALGGVFASLAGSAVSIYDRELRLRCCEGPLFAELDLSVLLGQPLPQLAGPRAQAALRTGVAAALVGDTYSAVIECEAGGEGPTLAINAAPYRMAEGEIEGALVHWQDISVLVGAQREHDEGLGHFQIAFDRAPVGMAVVSLDGRLVRVNEALCDMTGFSAAELIAMAPFALIRAPELDFARTHFAELVTRGAVTVDLPLVHVHGHTVWVQVRAKVIVDAEGAPSHVLAQWQDVSERRIYEERLRHMADHDPLTGLLNRRGLDQAIAAHLTYCRRYGASGAVLVLDLDGFKTVNDTLGHAAGDELICACAHALAARLRESDTIARLGGDEFAVLLPTQTEAQARTVADSLLETVREHTPGLGGGRSGHITASVGVAMFDAATLSQEQILVDADLAMYDAKGMGKNRHVVFGRDGREVPRLRSQMATLRRLELALAEERLVLHAQPIVAVTTGEVAGYELLVRLRESGGLIPPAAFLDVAERFGIVQTLDRWVLGRAISAIAAASERGRTLPLAVNLSARSLDDEQLAGFMAGELERTGVPAECLTIEVTESTALDELPRVRAFARELTAIGCRVALDDFGAGFGSFHQLKRLPFNVLKIDGEFVRQAIDNVADRLIIAALAGITRGLGRQTVAKYVENAATFELLRTEGVDLAQGYHTGMPVPLEELMDELALPA